MGKEPKILFKNLNWAYGKKTGTVPYIYNKDKSAIKLYSKEFGFEVLQLSQEQGYSTSQKATKALEETFQDTFESVATIEVYEKSCILATQIINYFLAGCELGDIPFSKQDISAMQRIYNRHMQRTKRAEEKQARKDKAIQDTQDAIMDF